MGANLERSGIRRGIPQAQAFWLNINAELVVYGATEPDARVTVGGRAIQLRPDGSFSYRFAFPDGVHVLPVSAAAANGETRQAEFWFQRGTSYSGEVGIQPQDFAIKPPAAENVT